jgi:hypothetical protein
MAPAFHPRDDVIETNWIARTRADRHWRPTIDARAAIPQIHLAQLLPGHVTCLQPRHPRLISFHMLSRRFASSEVLSHVRSHVDAQPLAMVEPPCVVRASNTRRASGRADDLARPTTPLAGVLSDDPALPLGQRQALRLSTLRAPRWHTGILPGPAAPRTRPDRRHAARLFLRHRFAPVGATGWGVCSAAIPFSCSPQSTTKVAA